MDQERQEVEKQGIPVPLALALAAALLSQTIHLIQFLSSSPLEVLLYSAQLMIVQPQLLPEPPSLLEISLRHPAGVSYRSILLHPALL